MATYGFLDVLEEELDKNFPFDYEISWDKRNHAVEVSFLLEVQNPAGVEMLDEDGEVSSDDILFEESVLFYNTAKSTVNAEDYLTFWKIQKQKSLSWNGTKKSLKKEKPAWKRENFTLIRDTRSMIWK